MMDGVIYEDSPLAAYLEGEGTADTAWVPAQHSDSNPDSAETPSFAPRGQSNLQSKIREKLRQPLRVHIPASGPVSRIHGVCSRAVNSRLGRADNTRFLEHFRYIIITSQLLEGKSKKHISKGPAPTHDACVEEPTIHAEGTAAAVSLSGALCTGAVAFALVWLLHWARRNRPAGMPRRRLVVVIAVIAITTTFLYAYVRRQWLHSLRRQAVNDASVLVTNFQALQASTSSTLTLIKEVELVSHGYRLSSPLPPISRLDEKSQSRRCVRLRKTLRIVLTTMLPPLREACRSSKRLVDDDILERYLDAYDISNLDIEEADVGLGGGEHDDVQALKALKILNTQVTTLRRVLLCSLLALEADGGRDDFIRWRSAVDIMKNVASVAGNMSTKLNDILGEEERFSLPTTPKGPSTPGREQLRGQIRKMGELSSGVRGIQAKLQVLREESNRTLEESEDYSELSPNLLAQYESIGTELRHLLQAWESGRHALVLNIDRHERRVSQASSGLRSPAPSLGGLTVVEEGTPSDALRALNGELSTPSDPSGLSAASGSDEEIFEAIAMPKRRITLSKEERQAKIQEDRVRQATFREQRDASTSMIRELEAVINCRPKKTPAGRVTSI